MNRNKLVTPGQIKEAFNLGYSVFVVINGEWYEIDPEAFKEEEKSNVK